MKYIIALDQGTTSSRSVLVNEHAEIVSITQKEFRQIFPQAGWVEHDPKEILSSQLGVLSDLIQKNRLNQQSVRLRGILSDEFQ